MVDQISTEVADDLTRLTHACWIIQKTHVSWTQQSVHLLDVFTTSQISVDQIQYAWVLRHPDLLHDHHAAIGCLDDFTLTGNDLDLALIRGAVSLTNSLDCASTCVQQIQVQALEAGVRVELLLGDRLVRQLLVLLIRLDREERQTLQLTLMHLED